jgi:hypothetical protein
MHLGTWDDCGHVGCVEQVGESNVEWIIWGDRWRHTNVHIICTFCQKKIGIMGRSGQASEKRQDRGFFPIRLHLSRVVLYTNLRKYSHMWKKDMIVHPKYIDTRAVRLWLHWHGHNHIQYMFMDTEWASLRIFWYIADMSMGAWRKNGQVHVCIVTELAWLWVHGYRVGKFTCALIQS